jgi:hypothetical protein
MCIKNSGNIKLPAIQKNSDFFYFMQSWHDNLYNYIVYHIIPGIITTGYFKKLIEKKLIWFDDKCWLY